MAMLRSSRSLISRVTCSVRSSIGMFSAPGIGIIERHLHSSSVPSNGLTTAATDVSIAAPRGLISSYVSPSAGMALIPAPLFFSSQCRSYSKRPKKWQGGPHAFVQVEPGVPVPPYQPNEGSVKNRKHKKRMAQRDAFAKAQAQRRKAETKAAVIARDAARRKRWREVCTRFRFHNGQVLVFCIRTIVENGTWCDPVMV
ncbi:hypothetical protein R1flu_017607 [Riccia fluitans]|uniref:Uncharacterized protein n=1 Tax=Riccia fluitans TaxID=41844 RepID=A0ABD1ZGU7_9MARC